MFIPLKMALIGIDPYPCLFYVFSMILLDPLDFHQVAFLHLRPIEDTQHAQDLGTTFDERNTLKDSWPKEYPLVN